jgi:hypothetical protein
MDCVSRWVPVDESLTPRVRIDATTPTGFEALLPDPCTTIVRSRQRAVVAQIVLQGFENVLNERCSAPY